MEKLKKFCKKPLFIVSLSIIAFCIVSIIVMICIPHGKVYKLSYEVDGTKFYYQITLDDKYSSKHTYILDGQTYNVGDFDGNEYDYEVVDGELFILDGGVSNQKIKIGDIDSRKIVLEYNILSETTKSTLTCKVNKVLTTTFVVGLYVGIALFVLSIVVICFDKKNKGNNQKTETAPAENVEQTPAEVEPEAVEQGEMIEEDKTETVTETADK